MLPIRSCKISCSLDGLGPLVMLFMFLLTFTGSFLAVATVATVATFPWWHHDEPGHGRFCTLWYASNSDICWRAWCRPCSCCQSSLRHCESIHWGSCPHLLSCWAPCDKNSMTARTQWPWKRVGKSGNSLSARGKNIPTQPFLMFNANMMLNVSTAGSLRLLGLPTGHVGTQNPSIVTDSAQGRWLTGEAMFLKKQTCFASANGGQRTEGCSKSCVAPSIINQKIQVIYNISITDYSEYIRESTSKFMCP